MIFLSILLKLLNSLNFQYYLNLSLLNFKKNPPRFQTCLIQWEQLYCCVKIIFIINIPFNFWISPEWFYFYTKTIKKRNQLLRQLVALYFEAKSAISDIISNKNPTKINRNKHQKILNNDAEAGALTCHGMVWMMEMLWLRNNNDDTFSWKCYSSTLSPFQKKKKMILISLFVFFFLNPYEMQIPIAMSSSRRHTAIGGDDEAFGGLICNISSSVLHEIHDHLYNIGCVRGSHFSYNINWSVNYFDH